MSSIIYSSNALVEKAEVFYQRTVRGSKVGLNSSFNSLFGFMNCLDPIDFLFESSRTAYLTRIAKLYQILSRESSCTVYASIDCLLSCFEHL